MKKIVIAGGAGFVGKNLAHHLVRQGRQVVILSRQNHLDEPGIRYVKWDAKELGSWMTELENAEALINLCGKSVNCRYTPENKELIYDSRLHPTYLLGEAIGCCQHPPGVWINGTSATIYRHAEDRPMTENDGVPGTGFSVDVCQKWESRLWEADTPGTRKVSLRMALVMGKKGGVLPVYERLVRFGLGGRQGLGWQRLSWIHEEDLARAVEWIIEHRDLEGVFNAAAPEVPYNHQFMKQLRHQLKIPIGLPANRLMLKLGSILIGSEAELVLKSRWISPERLKKAGFQFQFPTLQEALTNLV
ncbi:TIGR01777 family oxidoreductase [bacterium SCSIO 12741]|nr:TIGR01777 family oxidoreductase [bacterium SCSIO 12741]